MAEEQLDLRGDALTDDALTDDALTRQVRFHEAKGSKAAMVPESVETPRGFGVVILAEDGRSRASSKHRPGDRFSPTQSIPASTCWSRR